METFRSQFGLRYQILLDSQGKVWRQYGMGYIPHNVVLSPDWVVRYTNYGYDKAALIQTIETWLPQTGVKDETPRAAPENFQLSAVYPNPFVPDGRSSAARVRIWASRNEPVEVAVFDLRGRKIRSLFRGPVGSGGRSVVWDGRDRSGNQVPAGVYLIRARCGQDVATRRVAVFR